MGSNHNIDVIIPTTGRATLGRALESVRNQTRLPAQIIVVLDDLAYETAVRQILRENETLVITAGREGGARARNRGLEASRADFVAYLDDDDWWEPAKLEVQAEKMELTGATLSFTFTHFHQTDGKVRTLPLEPYHQSTRIGDYLVKRPGLRHGAGYMQTSSMMISRPALGTVRWDPDLPKHQDWDYVLMLSREPNLRLLYLDDVLVNVTQASLKSVSLTRAWSHSERWLKKHGEELGVRARGDFVATQMLRSSLARGDRRGIISSFRQLLRYPPHFAAALVGVSGMREYIGSRSKPAE